MIIPQSAGVCFNGFMTTEARPELSTAFQKALLLISDRLNDCPVKWAVSGSLGFWLHGMKVIPADIDLQTTAQGAYQLEKALGGQPLKKVHFSQAERIRSHYGSLRLEGVKVEIIGDVEKRLEGNDWDPPPDLEQVTEAVEWEGIWLPVVSLEYELDAYRKLGRQRRSDQIAAFLDSRS